MALCAGAALLAAPVLGNEVQEASRLLKAGQREQALERVNKALAAKPRDPRARFLKGLIYTEQGKTKDAIEIFAKLTEDHPELPEPYNNLAVIYASQGHYDKARAALEQSIRTHPSYATAYENLGDVYAKLASQAYDKALQIDSSNTGAQNKLSLVRELVGGPAPLAAKAAPPPGKPKATPQPEKPKVDVAKAEPGVPPADPKAEIMKAVEAWAQAWSRQDVEAYLASYAEDFKTPGGEPRADWEKLRRSRLEAPKSISVELDSPKVTMQGPDRASVGFRQTYRSDLFKGTSRKTLTMTESDGRWLIQSEEAK